MPTLSQFTLPVKVDGEIQNITYDLPSGGGGGGASSPEAIGIGYGTCSTAYATSEKAVTLAGYVLKQNGIVAVKFTNAINSNATLNINSKGAKPIMYRGSAIANNVIKAGDTVTFIYDGTNYNILSVDNLFEAFVLIAGDSEAVVTVTNSSAGISDTVILNIDGYGTYHVTQPGTYVFSIAEEED